VLVLLVDALFCVLFCSVLFCSLPFRLHKLSSVFPRTNRFLKSRLFLHSCVLGRDHKVSSSGHRGQFSSHDTPISQRKKSPRFVAMVCVYMCFALVGSEEFLMASVKPLTSCYSTAGLPTLTVPLYVLCWTSLALLLGHPG